jgi:molybdenum cofactor cytidylyltransferase
LLAAVILSAGASSRMGQPKALLAYRESTFLEHLIQASRHPKVGLTRVVLGAGADEIRVQAKLNPSMVVLNPDWEKGQLSSIVAALRSLSQTPTDGILLCPVDHPLVTAALIDELIQRFYDSGKPIVVPTHNGHRGHPVIFSSTLYGELQAAPMEKGARTVVWAHASEVEELPTDEAGVLLNINDPDMLHHVRF